MSNLTLNNVEIAILRGAVRRGDADDAYDELLQTLSSLCNVRTGEMYISRHTLEQIQLFGIGKKNKRWHATMMAVFRRTLGDGLGEARLVKGMLQEQPAENASSGAAE